LSVEGLSLDPNQGTGSTSSTPSASGDLPPIENLFIETHESYCRKAQTGRVYLCQSTIRLYIEGIRRLSADFDANMLPEPFLMRNLFGDEVNIPVPVEREFFSLDPRLRPMLVPTFNCDQAVGSALVKHGAHPGKTDCNCLVLPVNVAWQPRITLSEYMLPLGPFIYECGDFLAQGGFVTALKHLVDNHASNLRVKDLVVAGTGIVWHAIAQRLIVGKGAKIALAKLLATRFKVQQAIFCWPDWITSPTDFGLLTEMMEPLQPSQVLRKSELKLFDHISPDTFLVSMSPHWPLRQWLPYVFPTRFQAPLAILCNTIDMDDGKYEACKLLRCGKGSKCGVVNCRDPNSGKLQRWIKKHYVCYEFTKRNDKKHNFGDMSLYLRKPMETKNKDLAVLQKTLSEAGRGVLYVTEDIEKAANALVTESQFDKEQKNLVIDCAMPRWKSLMFPNVVLRDFELRNLYGVKAALEIPKLNPSIIYDSTYGHFKPKKDAWHVLDPVIHSKQALGATIRQHVNSPDHVDTRPIVIKYVREHYIKWFKGGLDNWMDAAITDWLLHSTMILELQTMLSKSIKIPKFRDRIKQSYCFTYETAQDEMHKGYEMRTSTCMGQTHVLRYWMIKQIMSPLTNPDLDTYRKVISTRGAIEQRRNCSWKLIADPIPDPHIPTQFVGPTWITSETEVRVRRRLAGGGTVHDMKNMDYLSALTRIKQDPSQCAIFSIRPHQPVRQLIADIVMHDTTKRPPLIVCERVDLTDELFRGCVDSNCPDRVLRNGRLLCKNPQCKDPIDPFVQHVFAQLYVEIGVISQDDPALGTLAMYVDKDLL
jgi:hypothetical protein